MSRSEEITHKIMSSIPSKDTKPEVVLRKELFALGLRYRVNYKGLKGRPDIVFTKARIAIFVDGDFWHGHNWAIRGYGSLEEELQRYSQYWKDKILRNIARDQEVNRTLAEANWCVLRFWESDIKTNLPDCVSEIQNEYSKRMEDNQK